MTNPAPITPTPRKFVPTETPSPTKTPLIMPTMETGEVHYEAVVRDDIPVLNVRNSLGLVVSHRERGDKVVVVARAESLGEKTVELVSEEGFDGWWCRIDPIDDLWVACNLLEEPVLDFNGTDT